MFQGGVVRKMKIHIFGLDNPPPGNRAVYEIMWENVMEPDMSQMGM